MWVAVYIGTPSTPLSISRIILCCFSKQREQKNVLFSLTTHIMPFCSFCQHICQIILLRNKVNFLYMSFFVGSLKIHIESKLFKN